MLSTKLANDWTREHFNLALRLYDFIITSLEWAPGIRYSSRPEILGPHKLNELWYASGAPWTGDDGEHTYTHLDDQRVMPKEGSPDMEELKKRMQYSTQGYVIMCNGGMIASRCKGYNFIMETVAEAEMVGLNEVSRDGAHNRAVWEFLTNKSIKEPTKCWVDNRATLQYARSGKLTHGNKHIARKHLSFVHRCQEGLNEVLWVPSEENPADLFTKVITNHEKFKYLSMIMLGWAPFRGELENEANLPITARKRQDIEITKGAKIKEK